MLNTDAVVIGAGLVGLAVARELARRGLETVVLERHARIGQESSSRNSGVIHAGIHYPPGSLKARACVRGKAMLYAFIEDHGIAYARPGKLIVAPPGGAAALGAIRERAERCGVADLRYLDPAALREIEPAVRGEAALFSPSTGIVDVHGLMLALQGDLEAAGGAVALSSPLEGARAGAGAHVLRVGGAEPSEIACRLLVNASGLYAGRVLESLGLSGAAPVPRERFAKGHWYAYSGPAPFRHLVYPLPEPGGLGVHATPDLGGQWRFGPDVRWVEAIDYAFDDGQRERFAAAIRRWFPGLDAARLGPSHTGIRPKLCGPGEPDADFLVLGPAQHGIRGFCSLHGIESPGLTACLALAEHAADAALAQ